MKILFLLCVAAMVPGALVCRADSPPTTHSAAATSSATSPRDAALQINAAMRARDLDAMIALHHAVTPEQLKYVRLSCQADVYVAGLLDAVANRFGADSVAKVQSAINDISDDDFNAADEKLDGDKATLNGKDERFSSDYIRIDGGWKVDVVKGLADVGDALQTVLDSINRRGNWAKVVAQDVTAGKYKTIDELLAECENEFGGD